MPSNTSLSSPLDDGSLIKNLIKKTLNKSQYFSDLYNDINLDIFKIVEEFPNILIDDSRKDLKYFIEKYICDFFLCLYDVTTDERVIPNEVGQVL